MIAAMPDSSDTRQVRRLLDQCDRAFADGDWELLRELALSVLGLDPQNEAALRFLATTGDQSDGPVQEQLAALLAEAETAADRRQWGDVRRLAQRALVLDIASAKLSGDKLDIPLSLDVMDRNRQDILSKVRILLAEGKNYPYARYIKRK